MSGADVDAAKLKNVEDELKALRAREVRQPS
jgi:hypothetical protein